MRAHGRFTRSQFPLRQPRSDSVGCAPTFYVESKCQKCASERCQLGFQGGQLALLEMCVFLGDFSNGAKRANCVPQHTNYTFVRIAGNPRTYHLRTPHAEHLLSDHEQEQIDHPTPANVFTRLTAVIQHVDVVASGVLKSISQNRHPVERASPRKCPEPVRRHPMSATGKRQRDGTGCRKSRGATGTATPSPRPRCPHAT